MARTRALNEISNLLGDIDLDTLLASCSLRQYSALAWKIVEPETLFVPNWHIDAISDHLEAVTRGQIRDLIITIAPRHAKSLTVSVFWPTWGWIGKPSIKWLYAAYAQTLSTRDSVKSRHLIQSPWYQVRWGDVFEMVGDQNEKTRYENDKTGYRLATSVGGSNTGEGGDVIVVDDPINLQEAHSENARKEVCRWWDEVMSSRRNDPKKSARVIIMQRCHEADLVGHLEAKNAGYERLNLPTEYKPSRIVLPSKIGWVDPRKLDGELLWPARFGPTEIAQAKVDLGSYAFASQHQQDPAPDEGGILKRMWWRYYKALPDLSTANEIIFSLDCAFKDLSDSDYVAGGVWARWGASCYLVDQVRDRMNFPTTLMAVRGIVAKWPMIREKLVEDKANGSAVVATLEHEIPGMIPVNPEGGKIARAYAVSFMVEAGNVYLPDPTIAPWIEDFVRECAVFPAGANDDQVDQCTQALRRFHESLSKPPSGGGVLSAVQRTERVKLSTSNTMRRDPRYDHAGSGGRYD